MKPDCDILSILLAEPVRSGFEREVNCDWRKLLGLGQFLVHLICGRDDVPVRGALEQNYRTGLGAEIVLDLVCAVEGVHASERAMDYMLAQLTMALDTSKRRC